MAWASFNNMAGVRTFVMCSQMSGGLFEDVYYLSNLKEDTGARGGRQQLPRAPHKNKKYNKIVKK